MTGNKEFMENMGERIKKRRKQLGLTQEELAERVDISRISIAKYESGENEPKLYNLRRIAKELDVSADYLLGNTSEIKCEQKRLSDQANEKLNELLDIIITDVKHGGCK